MRVPPQAVVDAYMVKRGGDVVLYDQEPAPSNEIHQPGPHAQYRSDGVGTYTRSPGSQSTPLGQTMPTENTKYDNVPPISTRVLPDNLRYAALIKDIMSKCGPDISAKAPEVQYRRARILPDKGLLVYEVQGSKGEKYKVRVKGVRKGTVKALSLMPVRVSCTCNYFRWQGPEHWAKTNDYLYGKPTGTASKPVEKDPSGQHWACKHVYAILKDAQKLKFASSEAWSFVGPLAPL